MTQSAAHIVVIEDDAVTRTALAGYNGFNLIAADFAQVEAFLEPVPAALKRKLSATWPGPVTWLLPARPCSCCSPSFPPIRSAVRPATPSTSSTACWSS